MPRLVVEKGADKGKAVSLPPSGAVTIGREHSCTLCLNDTMVSRHHARIEHKPDGYHLTDLDSMNGTFVNGTAVKHARLKPGDVIKVGFTVLSFAQEEAPPDPLVGQTLLGRYRILEHLGRGGMGTCYKAKQLDLDRIVALKVISPHMARQQSFVDLFIHEARFAARLNHPNVVSVYEVANDGDKYFFAMEYVPNGTLLDLVQSKPQKRLTPLEAVDITLQMARALEYAHSKNILHRDIKPENMLIGENGTVKLADLGLAQSLGEKISVGDKDHVLGTPHYIAPEIVRKQPFDQRSDLYSLGVTMYYMLTGTMPYTANSLKELIGDKLNRDAPAVDRVVATVPRTVAHIVAKLLRRNPDERYKNASELIRDLEEARRQMTDTRLPAKKLVLFAAAAVVLLAVILTAVIVAGQNPPPVSGPGGQIDEELAQKMLTAAELFKMKEMDVGDPDSIRKAIDRFDEIVQKFPNTPYAGRAAEHRRQLARNLNELVAQQSLAKIDQQEKQAYQRFYTSLNADRLDLNAIDAILQSYRSLAEDRDLKETRAARTAAERAAQIDAWHKAVLKLRESFRSAREDTATLLITRNYPEAIKKWRELEERIAAEKQNLPPAADPRYRDVVYDRLAQLEREQILKAVRDALAVVFREVDDLLDQKRFDDASRALEEGARRLTFDETAQQIAQKRGEIADRKAAWLREEDFKKQEAYRRALQADAAAYQEMSREVFDKHVCKYDFSGALRKVVDRVRTSFTTDAYRTRWAQRRRQLELADRFIRTFINVANAPGNPYNLNKNVDLPQLRIKGTLAGATESGLDIQVTAGIYQTVHYHQLRPHQFHSLIRGIWKINDPGTLADWIALCCEIGAYDRARAELEELARHPKFNESKELADFYRQTKAYIDLDEVLESEELEAEKRFALANACFDAGDYDTAQATVQLILSKLSETRFVQENARQLDDLSRRIRQKIKDSEKDQNREDQRDKFRELRRKELESAREAQAEILARVGRLQDEIRRRTLLGSLYLHHGQYARSNTEFVAAVTRINERMKKATEHEQAALYPELLNAYWSMMVNATALGDRAAFAQYRADVERIAREVSFTDAGLKERGQEIRAAFYQLGERMSAWADNTYRRAVETARRLEQQLDRDPLDPKVAADLAYVSQYEAYQFPTARSVLAAMIQTMPNSETVRSGDAHWSYAEILLGTLEVRKALVVYKELKSKFKDHPRVRDGSTDAKIKECRELMQLLDYRE